MSNSSREFQIFVKPVGSSCNLNCSYCYYLGKSDLYPGAGPFRMINDVLEKYISGHIEATTDDAIFFSWHGGEPLLAGLDFYKEAVRLQKKYLPAGRSLLNGIQTNGTLLNDEWCRFFASEGFIAGISIDGPGDLHNLQRRCLTGETSLSHALRGYGLLKSYGIETEILCVVGAHNVEYPLVIYNFFKELGARYITFLPLVAAQEGSDTGVTPDSVPARGFGNFLTAIFDEWAEKDIGKIKVQIFEEVARSAFMQEHALCIFKVNCGGVPVVECNGDFYSCDHFVNKDQLIGNIGDRSISGLLDSSEQKAFGQAKSKKLPGYCLACEVRDMCNGECPRNRFIYTPDGEYGLNYLCPGYKMFFNHCRPFVEAIRLTIGKE